MPGFDLVPVAASYESFIATASNPNASPGSVATAGGAALLETGKAAAELGSKTGLAGLLGGLGAGPAALALHEDIQQLQESIDSNDPVGVGANAVAAMADATATVAGAAELTAALAAGGEALGLVSAEAAAGAVIAAAALPEIAAAAAVAAAVAAIVYAADQTGAIDALDNFAKSLADTIANSDLAKTAMKDLSDGLNGLMDDFRNGGMAVDDLINNLRGKLSDWGNQLSNSLNDLMKNFPWPDGSGGWGGGFLNLLLGPFGNAQRDPLVIDLTGNGFNLASRAPTWTYYNWNNTSFANNTGWIGAGAGFLAVDTNGDGQIQSNELFGTSGQDGFAALAALDSNRDHVIDASDAQFSQLVVWQDVNGDGKVEAGELSSLSDLGIKSISLASSTLNQTINGNTVTQTAIVTKTDGTETKIGDVSFDVSTALTQYIGSQTISSAAAALPEINGYGTLLDLQRAVTADSTLQGMVQNLLTISPTDTLAFDTAVQNILYQWSGATSTDPTSRGPIFDAQKLEVIEAFAGSHFNAHGRLNPFFVGQTSTLDNAWEAAFQGIKARLLVQDPNSPLASLFHVDQTSNAITPNADFVKTIQSIAADAPTSAEASLSYWRDALTVVNAMVSDMGAFGSQVSATIATALATYAPSAFSSWTFNAAASGTLTYIDASPVSTAIAGSSTVYGTTGADLIDITAPNATIVGRGGGDEYFLGKGMGTVDIVASLGVSSSAANALYLEDGITPADISATVDAGGDYVLTLDAQGDKVKLEGFTSGASYLNGVGQIVFSDGTIWLPTTAGIAQVNTTGTKADDVLTGSFGSDVFDGKGGNDAAIGLGGNDTFIFNQGYGKLDISEADRATNPNNVLQLGAGIAPSDVTVTAVNGDFILTIGTSGDQITLRGMFAHADSGVQAIRFSDGTTWSRGDLLAKELTGSSSNDHILGTSGADILNGGGGNDYIEGDGGGDGIVFNSGYGKLEVFEHDTDQHADNALLLGPGIAPSDVTVTGTQTAIGLDNIVLNIGSNDDQITLDGMLSDSADGVQAVEFSDGTVWTRQDVINRATVGTVGSDTLYGTSGADTFDPKGGNDTIDTYGGGDIILFNAGYGQLTISDDNVQGLNNPQTVLKLGPGISPADVHVYGGVGTPIVLTDAQGDRITLPGVTFTSDPTTGRLIQYPSEVKEIDFADGTVWSGNQILQNVSGTYVVGTTGDDDLNGGSGAEVFDSQGDSTGHVYDYESGGGGGDTFLFNSGYGYLIVDEWDYSLSPHNVLQFGAGIMPSDVHVTRDGVDLLLSVGQAGDQVRIKNIYNPPMQSNETYGVQDVNFADGTVWSRADLLRLATTGTSSGDRLYGTPGAEVFDGKGGNDYENGDGGGDTFIFNQGYGALEVDETDTAANPNNTLQFGAGISPSDVSVSATPAGAYVLTIGSSGDQVTLDRMAFDPTSGVQRVTFADGTVWTAQDIVNHANAGQAYIGTTGDDFLAGGSGSDTFDGLGGNDIEQGGGGNDTFYFNQGYGSLEISEFDPSPAANNVLVLGEGITPSDVSLSLDSNGDVILTIGNNGDQVILDCQNFQDGDGVQAVKFADGTVWSGQQLYVPNLSVSPGFDAIYGTAGADVIDGQGGGDAISGDGGGDTIVFNPGYGQMSIAEFDASANPDNVLQLGSGIAPGDVSVSSDGTSIFLTVGTNGDSVFLYQMLSNPTAGIQFIEFADGTTWSKQDVLNMVAAGLIAGTPGSDQLIGTPGADTFDGKGGSDYEEGDGGNDTFLFNAGYGQLQINEQDTSTSANNVLQFGASIAASDVKVSIVQRATGEAQYVYDVVLTVGTNGDQVTLLNMASDSTSGVQKVEFADGTVWSRQDIIAQELAAATTGNDSLYGTSSAETFDGLGGSDVETGNGGGDTFVFKAGYGHLEVKEVDSSASPKNILQLAAGINPADVSVSNQGDSIVLTIGTSGDQVKLDQMLEGVADGIQQVQFAGGTIWSRMNLINKATIGTSGNDTLVGSPEANLIDGLGGNDAEYGHGGGDTFVFNAGYGTLEIGEYDSSSNPNNVLKFGPGISPSDISARSDFSGTITLTVGSNGDQVKLDSMLMSTGNGIQGISFADGTLWSRSQIIGLLTTGTSGNDNLVGTTQGETFNGLGGVDAYTGKGGNDTYLFNPGQQSVGIDNRSTDGAPHSDLQFGSGISASDLWFSRENGNLIITDLNESGQVIVDNWFQGDPSAQLKEIKLADGTEIDSQLNQLISAMAAFTNNNPNFNVASATQMPNDPGVQAAIAAAWHH